jgi:lantibiotic modifying enzyme
MFYKLNALMLAVVFLSSCSNIVQLKKEAHNQIRSVENIIVIEQDNLYVTVTSFYNGGGGAIGALIASSIDSSRPNSLMMGCAFSVAEDCLDESIEDAINAPIAPPPPL